MEAFYYVKNLQGDVVELVNHNFSTVAKYSYNAWGKITSVKDANGNVISDQNHIANINPIRYRGYYYDAETGFYYLQSRYYDPEVGRFLNADGILGANGGILGYNMFAYCSNNPVMGYDPSGEAASYCTMMADAGGLSPIITCDRGSDCFYSENKDYIDKVIAEYGSTTSSCQLLYNGSYDINDETRRREMADKIFNDSLACVVLVVFFTPYFAAAGVFIKAYEVIEDIRTVQEFIFPEEGKTNGHYESYI